MNLPRLIKEAQEEFSDGFVRPGYSLDKSPACGQTVEWHKVCCLCELPRLTKSV